jgi:bifunctional DNA-binding transcriptional regulator/antitoxin component of YhaV-PrlF toxin-antitoxin module
MQVRIHLVRMMDTRNRLVVPPEVCRFLDVKANDLLEFEMDGSTIRLHKAVLERDTPKPPKVWPPPQRKSKGGVRAQRAD